MKKIIALQSILLIAMGGALLYFFWKPESLLSFRGIVKDSIPNEPSPEVLAVLKELGLEGRSPTIEDVDRVRNYIFTHSVHKEGTDYHRRALDVNQRFKILGDIHAHSKGADFAPELSCGPRAWAMMEVMELLGIEWRLITLYFTEHPPGSLGSHTFLEVKEPSANSWQIQDPTINGTYSTLQGKRLSSLELLTTPRDQIQTLDYENDPVQSLWLNRNQGFRAIEYGFLGKGRRKNLLLLDDDFFSLDENLNSGDRSIRLRELFGNSLILEY